MQGQILSGKIGGEENGNVIVNSKREGNTEVIVSY